MRILQISEKPKEGDENSFEGKRSQKIVIDLGEEEDNGTEILIRNRAGLVRVFASDDFDGDLIVQRSGKFTPVSEMPERVLEEYFKIDLTKLDNLKREDFGG